jgi:hypothetical protein
MISTDNFKYKDDFHDSDVENKNYLRILFNGGRSVQIRELNQLQSILQSQIDKFGASVYKAGTAVIGGNCTFDRKIIGITFDNDVLALPENDVDPQFVETITQGSGNTILIADVIGFDIDAQTTTFYVRYSSSGGEDSSEFDLESALTLDSSLPGGSSSSMLASGSALFAGAFLSEGVFFTNGSFVITPKQQIFIPVDDEIDGLTGSIVLTVHEKFVTFVQDQTLLDNAEGMPNHLAPGADRYQITLSLDFVTDEISDDDVSRIVLHRVKNSNVIFNARARYNDLDRQLAQRTFEESGNYTLNPFIIDVENLVGSSRPGSNDVDAAERVYVGLDPSIAYVDGYRIELTNRHDMTAPRARTSEEVATNISLNIGNFVNAVPAVGSSLPLPNTVNLTYDLVDDASATIGSCRIKAIEPLGGIFRIFLYDISLNNGVTFSDVETIENSSASVEIEVLSSLQNAGLDTAVFPFPYENVRSVAQVQPEDFAYIIKKIFTGTANGSGEFTINTGANEVFFDQSLGNAIIESDDEWIALTGVTIVASSTSSITFGGLEPSESVKIIFPVRVQSNTPATKVLTTITDEVIAPTGNKYLLSKGDIFDVITVLDDSTEVDLTDLFVIFSDGQRESIYTNGQLEFIGQGAAPTIKVTYRHFVHNGLPFTINSYPINWDESSPLGADEIRYKDIPFWKERNLGDVVDFRPTVLASSGTVTAIQPDPNSALFAKPTYFLPRIDKVIVDSNGKFSIITGVPSINPVAPETPPATMVLYELFFPAYTFDANNITVTLIDNRRYTMRDIGKLDKRIKNLEYYTSLSLLERSLNERSIFDNVQGQRFKNGILIDSFEGHSVGDVFNPSYACSIDRTEQTLRPFFLMDAVDLVIDQTTGLNIKVNENTVSLDFDEVPIVEQLLSSESESVNPYDVASFVGNIKLYPTTDNWVEVNRRPALIVNDRSAFDAFKFMAKEQGILGTEWNSWQTTSTQTSTSREKINISTGKFNISRVQETSNVTKLQKKVGVKTTLGFTIDRQNLGDSVLEVNFLPFIRSRRVYFHASGLKPLTKVYPFFDGIDVRDYCATAVDVVKPRELTEVNEFFDKLPGDPNFITATDLISDVNGELIGVFVIPNNSVLKFRTGSRPFRLTDSTNNNLAEETTFAEGTYNASGQRQKVQATILSTRVPEIQQNRVKDVRIKEDTTTRWVDPLAQTFLINDVVEGTFLTSIDLWFSQKSSSTIPVSVHIVTVENGYPTQNIIPYSAVTKNADDVNIWSSDPNEDEGPTNFAFSDPVFIKSGVEYAFVVLSNDPDYRLRVARLGGRDESGKAIQENPYGGVMFMSQNASTWTPDQTRDMKFVINRAEFVDELGEIQFKSIMREGVQSITVTNPGTDYAAASVTISAPDDVNGEQATAEPIIDLSSGTIIGIRIIEPGSGYTSNPTVTVNRIPGDDPGTDATATASLYRAPTSAFSLLQGSLELDNTQLVNVLTFGSQSYSPVIANETYSPTSEFSITRTNRATITSYIASNSTFISPLIDLDTMSLLCIHNQINALSTSDTSELTNDGGDALSRYITREVELNDPADQLNLYLDVNRKSSNDNIRLYVKLKYDSSAFSDWILVSPQSQIPISTNPDEYSEVPFTYSSSVEFISFAIKIVFASSTTVDVSTVKNLRVIATS